MKKFILFLFCIIITACDNSYIIPSDIINNQIKEGDLVAYSPSGRFWTITDMIEDRILFEKHISKSSGGYSEYLGANGLILEDFASNFEFLYKGRLIGYNSADFKFYEIVYQGSYFLPVELSKKDVQELFPDLRIVNLSEAHNGVLKVWKMPKETLSFLIYNDTKQNFYKYQFEQPVNQLFPFNSILTVQNFGKYTYSHFKSRDALFPLLTLDISFY